MHPYFGTGARTIWKNRRYVVANRTDAVIYAEAEGGDFSFLRRLKNPIGRRHEGKLVSDHPGVGRSSAGDGTIHHALDRNVLRHETSAKKFASAIARAVGRECDQSDCRGLILVAEPHFLGLLRAELPDRIRKLVVAEVPREFVRLPDRVVARKVIAAIDDDLKFKPSEKKERLS